MRTWLFVCFVLGVCFAQEIFVVETGSSSPQSLFNIAGLTFRTLSPSEASRSGYAYSYQPSGLFADKPFQEGEVVLDIPAESTIGYVKILQDLPVLAEKRFSTAEEPFIVWLIHQRSLGSASPEWDFIKTLPDHLSTPLVYSTDFWSHFKDGTSQLIKSRAALDLNILYQHYQTLFPLIQDYPDVFDIEFFTFDEYLKAYSVITHMLLVNPNGQPLIVPALRFNHSPTALPVRYTADGNLQVVASRDIEIGDQIFISYGNKSNEDLVYQHGLTIEHNPYDCIRIALDINNPYWRTIAPFVFNTTTSTYKACVSPSLEWESPIVVHFRTFVAQPDEINELNKILNGERISIRNELFALRGLYAAVDTLRVTPEDVDRDSENLIAKFWLRFLQHRRPNLEQLLTRVMGFWDMFLVLDEVPELDD